MTLEKRDDGMPNQPVMLGDDGSGVVQIQEGVVVGDYMIKRPWLSLGQDQTDAEKGTPGKWRKSDTGEDFDTIEIVPMRIQLQRSMLEPGEFRRDKKRVCWSNDGLKPASEADPDSFGFKVGETCVRCPFFAATPYNPKKDGGDGDCLPNHVALVAMSPTWEPAAIRLRGAVSGNLVDLLRAPNVFQKAVVALTGKKVTTGKGSWYSVVPKVGERLEGDVAEYLHGKFAEDSSKEISQSGDNSEDAQPSEPGQAPAQSGATARPTSGLKLEGVVKAEHDTDLTVMATKERRSFTTFAVKDDDGATRRCFVWDDMATEFAGMVRDGDRVEMYGRNEKTSRKDRSGTNVEVYEFHVANYNVTAKAEPVVVDNVPATPGETPLPFPTPDYVPPTAGADSGSATGMPAVPAPEPEQPKF